LHRVTQAKPVKLTHPAGAEGISGGRTLRVAADPATGPGTAVLADDAGALGIEGISGGWTLRGIRGTLTGSGTAVLADDALALGALKGPCCSTTASGGSASATMPLMASWLGVVAMAASPEAVLLG
jgi:hypothetical protein